MSPLAGAKANWELLSAALDVRVHSLSQCPRVGECSGGTCTDSCDYYSVTPLSALHRSSIVKSGEIIL